MGCRSWEPEAVGDGPAVHGFVDATHCGVTTGVHPLYFVWSWGLRAGGGYDRMPSWATMQQAAELKVTHVAMDEAHVQ